MTLPVEKCQIKALLVLKDQVESKQILMVEAKYLVAPYLHLEVPVSTFLNQAAQRKGLT